MEDGLDLVNMEDDVQTLRPCTIDKILSISVINNSGNENWSISLSVCYRKGLPIDVITTI